MGEGFMGVIMESQWLGHWHWGIFSHPPPIIRWMEQEGVSTATYGRERMAGCCVGAHIRHSDLYHPGIRTHKAIWNDFVDPFRTTWWFDNSVIFIFCCVYKWLGVYSHASTFCEAAYRLPRNHMVRFPARGCLLHVISLSLSMLPVCISTIKNKGKNAKTNYKMFYAKQV